MEKLDAGLTPATVRKIYSTLHKALGVTFSSRRALVASVPSRRRPSKDLFRFHGFEVLLREGLHDHFSETGVLRSNGSSDGCYASQDTP